MKGNEVMKKIIIISLLAIFLINIGGKEQEKIIIPEDAIRYRVIANSDNEEDQILKYKVKNALDEVINPILLQSKTKEETKRKLLENTNLMNETVSNVLKENKQDMSYDISYGNHYFPEKQYYGVTYQEGDYESLIVTLGKGDGANFFCVLFPPLCLLEGEKTESEKVEYTSFIEEIFHHLFK